MKNFAVKYFFLILIIKNIFFATAYSQQSGRVYEFLSLPQNAKIAALGGLAAPDVYMDPGMTSLYSSLLSPEMNNHVQLNFSDHVSDITFGNVSYIRDYERFGTFSATLNYIHYGKFKETDQFGWIIGEFSPMEMSFDVAWGKQLSDNIRIGSRIKYINSSYYIYNSSGLAADVSMSYINPEHNLVLAALIRNAGRQVTYFNEESEPLPFDIILGVSKKLNNAPIRFSVVANNLHKYNLRFKEQEPEFANITDEENDTSMHWFTSVGDNVLRHLTIGMELMPFESFSFRLGYNYKRRQELGVADRMSSVGLSWGIGLKISKFEFHYGRSHYHLAGSQNHISIATYIDQLF